MRSLDSNAAYRLLTAPDAMQLGKGLFETLLVVDGKPLFLSEHVERLNSGLSQLGSKISLLPEMVYVNFLSITGNAQHFQTNSCDIERVSQHCTGHKDNLRQVLKLAIFLDGVSGYWHMALHPDRYSTGIPWPFVLGRAKWPQPSSYPLAAQKSMNYWARSLDLQAAATAGLHEIIYFDETGRLMEGAKTNLFIYKAKAWFTPSVESGILDGIARKWLIGALRTNGFEITETPLTEVDFMAAELVVVTNSLIGLSLGAMEGAAGEGHRAGIANAEHQSLLDWLKTLQAAYRGGAYGQFEENA